MSAVTPRLKLTEIFRSLQGEADTAGIPTVFIRLTGCPLRCVYCDTAYAFTGGNWWSLPDVLQHVAALNTRHVCVTGGEPLAQAAVHPLMQALCEAGHRVSLETSGAMSLSEVDSRVIKIVDVKTPASGEERRNRYEDFSYLNRQDWLKFVIADRADYEWSREQVRSRALSERCGVLFSPSHEVLPPGLLADWILEDQLDVRLQVQLHKYLWGNVAGK